MSVTAIRPDDFPQPPEPDLTPADVIARAEAIAPTLVARQAETEERTYYAPDVHEQFTEAGFYRILVPRRYGGYEFGVDTFMRVVQILAKGCPSTGWMFCLGAVHAVLAATVFEERVQDEIFSGGEFISPASIMPSGTAQRALDGGWIINGTWGYCSGSPYATHFIGHVLVLDENGEMGEAPVMFIAPRDSWRRLDDWGQQLGLRGSGSHSITLENVHVPADFVLDTHMSMYTVSDETPGVRLHGHPQYGGGPLSFMLFESATLALGIAEGALEAYEELMRTRTTSFPPIVSRAEDPDFQRWYGEATGKLAAAEAALYGAIESWQDLCAQGPSAFNTEREWRIGTICREVVRLSWAAVEQFIYPTAGSSAVRRGERIERVWRDLSMMKSHAGISIALETMANRELAKARFGIEDAPH
ncbi:acyl-CoA dehydrogenase family protein [Actinophytocola algeriensis]|uniref:3-hydroxy-9,10-secoandrosta-1,3,5(10)-triene-9, 17-dione monooxygenase n=1 Tax=Actinophytocola algeriensis TaxID=1768010 RepID=A0A7W7Q9B0_9PSEU|nr:acyl-CoA dehydrogenase family protein [Actinophytocola algeriensis]MBB4909385.1 3-hydroxy-9,10-secoandrosta-1,3,5(10)-triene-9,17-dione monooxygenase [Actinophytocola algeriensis]MBE1475375.1 3-hydroxy-9,10-secoandrosta-1,3,5(10)-triene-9,17-dione monooxygenase [Actinophytocola algeriensis]